MAGHYHVIAGHRRLAAAKLAGLAQVPVIIRRRSIGRASALQVMLIENYHRTDLSPVEKARAMGRLRDEEGWSLTRIAEAIGVTDATVSTYLTLLELAPSTQQMVSSGRLPVADAVRAVRSIRARTAVTSGRADRRKATAVTWEPDHFTSTHPLARKAQALCDAREHNNRRRIGKTACGACWEAVIREDERLVVKTSSNG
jgi:ParB family chromosome partitioning protein